MSISILGVRIDAVTEQQAVNAICQAASDRKKFKVATVNPEFIMAAQHNQQFKRTLDQSDLSLPDGVGVMWAANVFAYQGTIRNKPIKVINIWFIALWYGVKTFLSLNFRTANLPQQVSGSNLVKALSATAAEKKISIFLLGEKPGIAQRAANNLRQALPALNIAGSYSGDGAESGDSQTVAAVSEKPGDIILVAYGSPKQEFWIDRNINRIPYFVAIGVGGTFRFLAGEIQRAPNWVQHLGLEWLFRLLLEPWRWRRQLALPKFVFAVVRAKISSST